MKEYKVVTVSNRDKVEEKMNELAREGWKVVAVTHWGNLMLTFEKDAEGE